MNEGEFIVNMVCRAMMNDVLDKSVVLNFLFVLMSELHLLQYNDEDVISRGGGIVKRRYQ